MIFPLLAASSVSIPPSRWLWPLAIAALVLAGFVVVAYLRSPAKRSVRLLCATLKLLGILALVLCLLEPLWNRSRVKPGANFFVVLADNSQGMQIKDRGAAKSRGEELSAVLARDDWQNVLGDTFSVARYLFDGRVQRLEALDDLSFEGPASAIATSLRNIADRYHGQPLAGVLLFSDGNATDAALEIDTAGLPPIFPVVLGRGETERDISIQKVAVTDTAFEDAPVTIQASVEADGFGNEPIAIQLLDGAGRKVDEQTHQASSGKNVSARFSLKPPQRGVSFYTLRAAAKSDAANTNSPAAIKEATLANNTRTIAIKRGNTPHRVLYVSGRPNWEFKFLNRALAEDEQVQLVGLLRIARREPKFEFMGRRGETGNPLFRGFGQNTDEAERYDRPVLVRLNTRDEAELKGGFPKNAEELYGYSAVIIDDLEADFFTRDQMTLLQKFVSERGGGLLMLGGAESFREGKFGKTPIGDMLPVYLDRGREMHLTGSAKLALTRDGWVQPWLRLRDNEASERTRLSAMPGFEVFNVTADVKPGASVLATASDSQSAVHPAFAMQRFGNGRTGALLIGDVWQWALRDEESHRDADKAWRQTVRWLVTDVPPLISLQATENNGSVTLEVQARDKKFQPLDSASVQLLVSSGSQTNRGSTNAIRLSAEAVPAKPGVFTATYVPRQPGGYRAEAIVLDSNGAEAGRAETGWTSDPAAEEFRSLKPNRALMEKLAKQTGGEVIAPDQLNKLVRSLPSRRAPVTETYAQPLWHTPAIFLIALLCFASEWGVRRWKGLP